MNNGSKVVVCAKSLSDAVNDYDWQSDPELAYLTAIPPLNTAFSAYLLSYIGQLRHQAAKHQFAIKTRSSRHIGNCVCYGIDHQKKEAEIGIMIGDRSYWDKGYGTDALAWMVDYAFNQLKLQRVHLKTLESNIRAQKCFTKCGFNACGSARIDGCNFILMELYCEQWRQNGAGMMKQEEVVS